ncbi:hypothetical protein FQN54_002022 [Arachnomyces sp. PD_36]|nr:hypothetical protein FQN54_002022 [Arachnomyces sp. PD_36]
MQQTQDVCRDSSQNSDSLYYRDCKAQWAGEDLHDPSKRIEVDLDTIESHAARWWAAVLAPGEGWAATVCRKGQIYRSPWSVRTATIQSFVLRVVSHNHKSHDTEFSPPSSTDALRFLSDFCTTHNVHSQGLAALSAAMYLPFHNGATATLPCPKPCLKPTTTSCITSSPASPQVAVDEEESLLPYYMTISCNIWGIRSLLHSTFFNPEIYCNLVSPWLEPAFKIIDPIVERGEYMLLASMMARRQPPLGSLWLGAILTGAAKPILRDIRSGQYALELNSSAWTSTTQSFLTVSPSHLDASDDPIIHRSDECRLLFLTGSEEHSRVPICPWKPFGTTSLCDTEIEVQTHSHCKGHSLQYIDWCWDLEGGMKLQDEGFDTTAETITKGDSPAIPTQLAFQGTEALKSHTLSEVATRSIFAWLRPTGYPSSERDIRTHPWLDLEDSDEELDGTAVTIVQLETGWTVYVASPTDNTLVERADEESCLDDCMQACTPPSNNPAADCGLVCAITCALPYDGGHKTSQIDLDLMVDNVNGRLVCW